MVYPELCGCAEGETSMGADLICYIAFGPKRIRVNDRRKTQIAQQVRQYLDACIAAAEQVLLGKKDVPEPRKSPVQAKRSVTLRLEIEEKDPVPPFTSVEEIRSHPEYRSLVQRVLTDCGHEVESDHVFVATPQDLTREIQEFVTGWNDGCFRDLAFRDGPEKPGRKVVVAGELSWGDEPDGLGYQMLKKAFGLGIAQRLGVS
jgi:hypothetical protein